MITVSRTFVVDQPVPQVVAYLADFGNAPQWDPGTQSCTRIDDGPVTVGATWRNVSKVLGRQTELTYRLDRLEPDRLTLIGTNKTATSVDDITVRALDDRRSQVTYQARIDLHGFAKLGVPVMKLEMERLGNATVTGIVNALAGQARPGT